MLKLITRSIASKQTNFAHWYDIYFSGEINASQLQKKLIQAYQSHPHGVDLDSGHFRDLVGLVQANDSKNLEDQRIRNVWKEIVRLYGVHQDPPHV